MAERKQFSGDRTASASYLTGARSMLAALKQAMSLSSLKVGTRTEILPNGVRITVSSMFGQDDIKIEVPAALTGRGVIAGDSSARGADEDNAEVQGRIESAVRNVGSIEIVATKTDVTPAYDEIIIVGYCTRANTYDGRVASWWSSIRGQKFLRIGAGGYASEAHGISPDGEVIAGCTTGRTSSGGMSMASYGAILNMDDAAYQASLVTIVYSTNHACRFYTDNGFFSAPTYLYGAESGIRWTTAFKADNNGVISGWGNPNSGASFGFQSGAYFGSIIVTPYATAPKVGTPRSMAGVTLTQVGRSAAYTKNGVTTQLGIPAGFIASTANSLTVLTRPAVITVTTSTLVFSG